ncbi:MAG: SpoIIE family protein phosphatase [Desulfobacterales bacterium]|nr:SpoIIE family protein phosphatase [Desulfobacterales bacterium]
MKTISKNILKHNSIKGQLSFILISVTTLILTGFVFSDYFSTRSGMQTELLHSTDILAKQLAISLKSPLWNVDRNGVEKIINSIMLEKPVYAVSIKSYGEIFGKIRDDRWISVDIGKKIIADYYHMYMKSEEIIIDNDKLGYVNVYVSPVFMREKLKKATKDKIIAMIILNLSLICALFTTIRKSVIIPISHIAESVRAISSGDLDRAVFSERKDEIGQLASDVEKMRIAIKDLTDNLEEKIRERTEQLQEAKDSLWGEMKLAKKIQTVLLPKRPEISGYEIAASMHPAEEVGGDYYDIISAAGCDWLVIGDVSGHGIPAGLVMMMVQTAIHTVLLQCPDITASDLLATVNKTIYENIKKMDESKHMTIIVMALISDGQFIFSGLHEDILVWRNIKERVDKVETDGMWIGIEPDISQWLSSDTLMLEFGDCMVLYTDGVTEARDESGRMFGCNNLAEIISKTRNKSASEIHENITEALKDYRKNDDITLLVVKRLENGNA